MKNKYSLALIALVGIGVFALPSTVALFSGQHSFYNIDATGNQIPCTKCHGDVKAELGGGGTLNATGTAAPHANFKCEYCHRAENGFASGDDAYAKITYSGVVNASDRIYLVTTVQNFERGNFPKSIVYTSGINVDNWGGSVFDINGNAYVPVADYSDGITGNYSGSLSPQSASGLPGDRYNYSYASESATTKNGAPKDTNSATATKGFYPRAVTWTATRAENLTGAGSREHTPGTKYHAASLVSCMECHGGDQNKGVPGYEISTMEPYNHAGWLIDPTDPKSNCDNCHYSNAAHTPTFKADLEAGGFGLTDYANDTGQVEAHKNWVTTNDTLSRFGYGASNNACVACHTHVAVDINFKKGYLLQFNATEYPNGTYITNSFAVRGNVNISVYGNSSGNAFAVSNSTYAWTPDTNLYMNGSLVNVTGVSDNAYVYGLNGNAANDSATALTNP